MRHGDDGIKAPKGLDLEPFIQAVLEVTAREAMHSSNRSDSETARDSRGKHVGTISMCVHDVRADPPTERSHAPALAQIRALRRPDLVGVDFATAQSAEKRRDISRAVRYGDDMDFESALSVSRGERAHDALQTSNPGGGGDVHDDRGLLTHERYPARNRRAAAYRSCGEKAGDS
jgi:hypothetical protein